MDIIDVQETPDYQDFGKTELPDKPLVLTVFANLPMTGEGVAFDGKGHMYTASTDGRILGIDAAGKAEVLADLLPVPDKVSPACAGVTVGPDGALYACRFSADRIERAVLDSPVKATVQVEGVDSPNTVGFAPDGSLWFTSSGEASDWNGFVGRQRQGTTGYDKVIDGVKYANGLVFSSDGKTVFFTATSEQSVYTAAIVGEGKAGAPSLVVKDERLAIVDGLALAPDGTLFIASFGWGAIMAWDGKGLVTVAMGEGDSPVLGVASLAFGKGPGFDPGTLYVSNLLQPVILSVKP